MITNLVIFAFIVGLLTLPVFIGASAWAKHLGLKMRWWKWVIAILWYVMLLFLIMAAFTFIGEGEPVAGWRTVGLSVVVMTILGAIVARILLAGRER